MVKADAEHGYGPGVKHVSTSHLSKAPTLVMRTKKTKYVECIFDTTLNTGKIWSKLFFVVFAF